MPGSIWGKANGLSYKWEGDLILQDTIMEDKRFVIGSPDRQIKADIREWISLEDNNIMKGIVRKLMSEKGLPINRGLGDFDRRAAVLWDFIARNVRYVHDTEKRGREDFWLFPAEVYALKEGDCEDSSFFLGSLLIASGISPFCVRVVLGEVSDEAGRSLGEHCWPVYKNEAGQWCILESTLDTVPARMPEADKLTSPGQSFQYKPRYCFNNHHLWEIFREGSAGGKATTLAKYLGRRGRKVHMRKTRLPSGGWLSRITGDWEPGHLEITGDVLKASGFSWNAVDVAGDASQDPDFYDWYTSAAHAQTATDNQGRIIESKEEAAGNYVRWMKHLTRRMLWSTGKDVRSGLFFLGYVLHGIQDLATHKGITSAQHSFMSKLLGKTNDPDHDEENRTRAKEYSFRYVEFLERSYPKSWEKLAGYKGQDPSREKLLPADKTRLLNKKGWDLTPRTFTEHCRLSRIYKKMRNDCPVGTTVWETDAVFETLLRIL
jgi:hypothetical protein